MKAEDKIIVKQVIDLFPLHKRIILRSGLKFKMFTASVKKIMKKFHLGVKDVKNKIVSSTVSKYDKSKKSFMEYIEKELRQIDDTRLASNNSKIDSISKTVEPVRSQSDKTELDNMAISIADKQIEVLKAKSVKIKSGKHSFGVLSKAAINTFIANRKAKKEEKVAAKEAEKIEKLAEEKRQADEKVKQIEELIKSGKTSEEVLLTIQAMLQNNSVKNVNVDNIVNSISQAFKQEAKNENKLEEIEQIDSSIVIAQGEPATKTLSIEEQIEIFDNALLKFISRPTDPTASIQISQGKTYYVPAESLNEYLTLITGRTNLLIESKEATKVPAVPIILENPRSSLTDKKGWTRKLAAFALIGAIGLGITNIGKTEAVAPVKPLEPNTESLEDVYIPETPAPDYIAPEVTIPEVSNEEITIGSIITLKEGSSIFNDEYSAYNGENAKTAYYSAADERVVEAIVYANDEGQIRIVWDSGNSIDQIKSLEENGYKPDSVLVTKTELSGRGAHEGFYQIENVISNNISRGAR